MEEENVMPQWYAYNTITQEVRHLDGFASKLPKNWYRNANVKSEKIGDYGEILISTAFLGLDHRYDTREGTPIVFETMIFIDNEQSRWGYLDNYTKRYSTAKEALQGHRILATYVKLKYEKFKEKDQIL